MISRLTAAAFLSVLAIGLLRAQEGLPDFGDDGRAGLTKAELIQLEAGGLVLPRGSAKTARGGAFIEGALVFERPLQEAWDLLSETEAQDRFVLEVKSARIVWKEETKNCLEFTVRAMGRTVVYRAVHEFFPEVMAFRWSLDPEPESDLRELDGFWRLYAFGEGRTLARYGSAAKPRFPVPGFIRKAEARRRTRPSLEAVKKYVDSGGVWRVRREDG